MLGPASRRGPLKPKESDPQCCVLMLVKCQQALEKSVEAGGALDQYEIEGPDRAELLQDLAEFQLAAVSISYLSNCLP